MDDFCCCRTNPRAAAFRRAPCRRRTYLGTDAFLAAVYSAFVTGVSRPARMRTSPSLVAACSMQTSRALYGPARASLSQCHAVASPVASIASTAARLSSRIRGPRIWELTKTLRSGCLPNSISFKPSSAMASSGLLCRLTSLYFAAWDRAVCHGGNYHVAIPMCPPPCDDTRC
jgi:hypothetical protein